jgi:V8-like Glu-specific endopeptidase
MEKLRRVEDAGLYPGCCHLVIARKKLAIGRRATGSGILIDSRHVLTAAHNCSSFGGPLNHVQYIDVRAGRGRVDDEDSDVVRSETLFVAPGYRGWFGSNFRRDFALIRLAAPVVGVAPTPLATRPPERGERLTVVGYPGDSTESSSYDGYTLFHGTGQVLDLLPDEVEYGVDTATGLSGGAILNEAGEITAVHTRSGRGESPGVGRIVDDFMRSAIARWRR